MGLLGNITRLFRPEAKGMSSLELFKEVYGGRESRAGVSVSWTSAMDVATVQACVRTLRNGVAQVPFPLILEAGGRRERVKDHPVARVLEVPNPWQTKFTFFETMMTHVVLTGNAFAWKGMVGAARELRRLEPIDPGRVTVIRADDGSLTYKVRADDGAAQVFSSDEIWHMRGPAWAPWLGLDATKLARDAIGLAIATEQAHADFHKGARVSGLLSMDGSIGAEKFVSLAAWLDKHSPEGERAGKPLVLDNGAKYTPFGMTGVDAQHLETRKFQVEEICRAFGVQPIMVFQSDKTATYASAEQMFIAHVVHTLMPWYVRIEESANANLLSQDDRDAGYYLKFMPNGLMRGAAKDRAEVYSRALGGGGAGTAYMTPNEIRALEDMDPIDGGDTLPTGTAAQTGATNGTN